MQISSCHVFVVTLEHFTRCLCLGKFKGVAEIMLQTLQDKGVVRHLIFFFNNSLIFLQYLFFKTLIEVEESEDMVKIVLCARVLQLFKGAYELISNLVLSQLA